MITLDCGCEYTGKRPNFEDPGLLAVAFWCPNGHEGMQGWHGEWPPPPVVELAAVGERRDGTMAVLAKGTVYKSIVKRATREFRETGGWDTYRRGWTIVKADEIPVLAAHNSSDKEG